MSTNEQHASATDGAFRLDPGADQRGQPRGFRLAGENRLSSMPR